jgi:hypothetical protein
MIQLDTCNICHCDLKISLTSSLIVNSGESRAGISLIVNIYNLLSIANCRLYENNGGRSLMKAAMLYGPRDIRIEDIPRLEPTEKDVLVKIHAVGICPSDLRGYTGARTPRTGYPTTMGHEWVGEIVNLPATCDEFKIGDRVAAMWASFCGDCYYCRKGELNRCIARWGHTQGGFMEYGLAPSSSLRKLHETTPYTEAAFAEPLACCLNGHKKLNYCYRTHSRTP